MKNKIAAQEGDYFHVPMEDGRTALGQVVWLGVNSEDKMFKNIFAFAVLAVGDSKDFDENCKYLRFENYRGEFFVIFTSVENINSGEWPIVRSGTIKEDKFINLEFNMAGTLYRKGFPVRMLSSEEYKDYSLMGVAGYALVEEYLQQY